MRRNLLARLLVAAAACVVAVALLSLRADARDCRQAGVDLYLRAATAGAPVAQASRRLVESCAGSEPLVRAAGGLRHFERWDAATRLARLATAREPDSYGAWAALAQAARGDEAERAREQALELNPLAARASR
ncbi:MAG: hypothetical protein WEB79_05760 [Thermoleophilaceae bacterium]